MIPVRFTASAEQAKKLADLALEHYDQKAVMGNKVARCRDVIFRKRSYRCNPSEIRDEATVNGVRR
jgi:hypothetical protein